ncbi:MAG: hypothetical protein IK065_03265 [Neisseriaceae bacterium]|nr:hypothetical protein [Neisseriaceae bacterium]
MQDSDNKNNQPSGRPNTHQTLPENNPNESQDSDNKNNHPSGSLPDLKTENWQQIVSMLISQLGPASWLAEHSYLSGIENNQIVISFHKDGKTHQQISNIKTLGQVLAKHYGTDDNLKIKEWQDDYKSIRQIEKELKEEQQQQNTQFFQQDPQAVLIAKIFGGQWQVL